MKDLHCFDRKLDPLNYEAGIKDILAVIKPDWNQDAVEVKKFTVGLTNTLVGCCHEGDSETMLLFRLYGDGTDLFIDRDAERLIMQAMHRAGCGRPLLATFTNGLVYGFQPGCTLTTCTVRAPAVFPLVAAAMARLHRIRPPDDLADQLCIWPALERMMKQAPSAFDDPRRQKRFVSELRSPEELRAELCRLRAELEALDVPAVFCHNDILLENIVVTPDGDRVYFIDFEYGGLNYQAYDIGNHFNEWAGINDVDYSLFPDRSTQLQWLRCYLATYLSMSVLEAPLPAEQQVQPTNEQVELLYVQANKFSLLSHFFWGCWALAQTSFSKIDFDYLEYAIIRFAEYDRRKKEVSTL